MNFSASTNPTKVESACYLSLKRIAIQTSSYIDILDIPMQTNWQNIRNAQRVATNAMQH